MLMTEEYFGFLWHHSWLNAVKFVGGIRREGPNSVCWAPMIFQTDKVIPSERLMDIEPGARVRCI